MKMKDGVHSGRHKTWSESFCPGNGTRYDLLLVELDQFYVLCWLNKDGANSGKTMKLTKGTNFLHHSYMQEKLNVRSDADIAAVLVWVNRITDGKLDIEVPHGFDGQSGLRLNLTLVH